MCRATRAPRGAQGAAPGRCVRAARARRGVARARRGVAEAGCGEGGRQPERVAEAEEEATSSRRRALLLAPASALAVLLLSCEKLDKKKQSFEPDGHGGIWVPMCARNAS